MAEYVAAHELGTYSIKVMGECLAPRIVNRLLFPGEKIAFVLQGIRDVTVYTDQRILVVNFIGVSGRSVEYTTYAYKDIHCISISTYKLGEENILY